MHPGSQKRLTLNHFHKRTLIFPRLRLTHFRPLAGDREEEADSQPSAQEP